jgi:hypothetical protein
MKFPLSPSLVSRLSGAAIPQMDTGRPRRLTDRQTAEDRDRAACWETTALCGQCTRRWGKLTFLRVQFEDKTKFCVQITKFAVLCTTRMYVLQVQPVPPPPPDLHFWRLVSTFHPPAVLRFCPTCHSFLKWCKCLQDTWLYAAGERLLWPRSRFPENS